MIPDHLIDQAAAAYIKQWGRTGNLRAALTAAIEATAADIWGHGYVDGVESAHDYFNGETKADTPNPYRASETA